MSFLPMKPKTRRISPKNALFWGTFHPKTTNFPTRNLHFTNLPAVPGVNTCFTATADPKIGGWGCIPTHETQNRQISPPKCTFFGTFHPKTTNFPTRSLHSTDLPAVPAVDTSFTMTGVLEIGGWGPIPTHETQNIRIPPEKKPFLWHFSSKNHKFCDQKSALRTSTRSPKGQYVLHCDRRP